mmetsp:Transcript_67627/g.117672  ORF Transcript_67627/g.117672 Transcript_67627/m.117672 type:complete len:488 (+) Transcript_67627:3-1466(+)
MTTLSLSSVLQLLDVSWILVFDMCHSRTNPIAEIFINRKDSDESLIRKMAAPLAVAGQLAHDNRFRSAYSLKISRTTPVLMTRLLSELRARFSSERFQEKYLSTPPLKRVETALTVQSAVLPRHGFSGTPSGVTDMRGEVGALLQIADLGISTVMTNIHVLLEDPVMKSTAHSVDPSRHAEDMRATCHMCVEAVIGHHLGLEPSLVEQLVAAHGIIARVALTDHEASVKACEAICMAVLRDEEFGACPIIERSFLKTFVVVARAAYIATAWQRRQLVLDRVRIPRGYQSALSAVNSAKSMRLDRDPVVEKQRLALRLLDTEMLSFLEEVPDMLSDTSELALDWKFGIRNLDAEDAGGATVLHMVAGDGQLRLLRALMAVGACTNRCDHLGRTPAHWAAMHGQQLALAALVARPPGEGGGDVDIPDTHGRSPRQLAVSNDCEVPVEHLRTWWTSSASISQKLGSAAFMDDGVWSALEDNLQRRKSCQA